jgi:periplasmic protein TonB
MSRSIQASLLVRATLATALLASFAGAARAAEPAQQATPVSVTGLLKPAEVEYVNQLHGQLDREKRYPTGRAASLLQPSGATAVWVDVDRAGQVVARGIESTSYSQLLDTTAMALIGRTSYGAFPADAWGTSTTHRFRVTYRFRPSAFSTSGGKVAVATEAE